MFDMSAWYAQADGRGRAPADVRRADARRLPPPPARRPSWPRRLGWGEPIAHGEAEREVAAGDSPTSFASAWPSVPPAVPPSPPSSHPPPVVPVWPWANTRVWPQGPVVITEMPEVDVDFAEGLDAYRAPSPAPRLGLGWYAVAVAWLATITMAALLATNLPGHVTARGSRVALVPSPAVVVPPAVAAPAAVVLPAAAMAAPLPAPLPAPASDGIPEISASMLPVATTAGAHVPVAPLHPAPAPAPKPAVAAVAARPPAVPRRLAHPAPAEEVEAPAAHARSQAAAPAPATPPAPAPVAAAAAPAKPASTANMSLEDLIRHEVQAESAKHH